VWNYDVWYLYFLYRGMFWFHAPHPLGRSIIIIIIAPGTPIGCCADCGRPEPTGHPWLLAHSCVRHSFAYYRQDKAYQSEVCGHRWIFLWTKIRDNLKIHTYIHTFNLLNKSWEHSTTWEMWWAGQQGTRHLQLPYYKVNGKWRSPSGLLVKKLRIQNFHFF